MAETPEGRVKRKARDLYKKHHAVYDRAAATGMGKNGRPDDLVCRSPDGHMASVEFKKEAVFKVTALQHLWLNSIAEAGGSSLVVNETNLELLEQWLSKPGCKINAMFFDAKHKDLCTHHAVYKQDVFITHVANTPEKQG